MTTATDTALHVEFKAEARIEVTFDVAAYFESMPAVERAEYRAWTDPDFWDGEAETKPIDYLTYAINERAEVESGFYGRSRGLVYEGSDLDAWDVTPKKRHGRSRGWTREHYDALLAAVPWLAALDAQDDEDRAEAEARRPGPADVPLFPEGS